MSRLNYGHNAPRVIQMDFRLLAAGAGFALAALSLSGAASGVSAPTLYGDQIAFDVYREGERIGSHTVSFRQVDDELIVDAQFNIAIKFLIFTAYTLDYTSTARWRAGKLQSLQARTDDDGDVATVSAERRDGTLRIKAPDGAIATAADLIPTNHWNVAVTQRSEVLNTITGKINKVELRDLGLETVTAEGLKIEARRWAYTGDLQNEVWYDDSGRWVKMRFFGKDNSVIEYQCTKCLGRSATAVAR